MCIGKKPLFLRVQGSGRPYTEGDTRLVWRTLELSGASLPKFTKELLQPNWRYVDAQTGMSFLHAVVDKLARKAEYTEKKALADVKELTGNQRQVRCLVMYHDPEGKTALDRVTDMDEEFPLLVGELTKKQAAQTKKSELCQAARDLEQGWLQVQQNQ
ncbi:hypothetical protein NCS52_00510000 [Fusarium sp. LHS14.1]|nr:hypothetical protein NCS52_00510000 [Fusarium sp. LHS14.1]